MANVTTMVDINDFRVLEATSTESSVLLDVQKEYTLAHLGLTAAGAAAAGTIFFRANAATVDSDYSNETSSKLALKDGTAVSVGPGISTLYFETAADSPVFQIIAGKHYFGQW